MIEDVIPDLLTDEMNAMLTNLPSKEEVHKVVLAMNKEGAPSPDGFGASFFQSFLNIVKQDVYNAVI